MPELGADEEEGGGGVNQGVRVHTAHYGQNSFIAGHVRPAIKRPVGQGQLEEGEDVTKTTIYENSGPSLNAPPMGQKKVSILVRCTDFRG